MSTMQEGLRAAATMCEAAALNAERAKRADDLTSRQAELDAELAAMPDVQLID